MKDYCYGHSGETSFYLHSLIVHIGNKSNKGHYFLLSRRGPKNVQTHVFRNGFTLMIPMSNL